MAFRADNTIPNRALQRAKAICRTVKVRAQAASSLFASGADAQEVLAILGALSRFNVELATLKTTPGLAQYAKDQENDQNYDVVAEFNAVLAALDDFVSTVLSNFPADGSGYALAFKFDASGTLIYRTFTAAQLATITSKLDAVDSAIT